MPVKKRGKKWAIGSGKGKFKSKAAAERALKGYYKWLKKNGKKDEIEKLDEISLCKDDVGELPLFEEFINSLKG